MASTRLTDPMITALLETLRHRRTDDGRYETFAPVRTRSALVARGKVVRTQEYRNNEGEWVVRWYLTEEGVTYLREALTYVLSKGEERDAVWTEWLNAERRNRAAVIDFLGLTADSYDFTATTPLDKRNPRRETLDRTEAYEHMGSVMADGWRITRDDSGLTATNDLGASWTFKPLGFAVEIERTSYERHTGAHGRGWSRKIGTDNPASVRFMIDRANRCGDAVVLEDGGVIRVDNAGRVDPGHDGAGEPCPVWFVPVRPAEEGSNEAADAASKMARAESLVAKLRTAEEYAHRVTVKGRSDDATFSRAVTVETIAGELRQGARASWMDDGSTLVLRRDGFTTRVQPAAAPQEAPAPRTVATSCSCGAGIEKPMNGPRPACTHNGETRPNGGIVIAGRVVRPADRGACWTDAHRVDDVPRWVSGNYVPRCGVCVAADLGVSVEGLPGFKVPQEAAALLGDGERWVKHFHMFGRDPKIEDADRAAALALIVWARGEDWQCYRADAGGVNLESTTGESSYWLEPVVKESPEQQPCDGCGADAGQPCIGPAPCEAPAPRKEAAEEAVNLAARWVPQDPAEEGTRSYVEIGGALVFVYRKGGRLVVSIDVDTAEDARDDGTVPMVITVQGKAVFEG